KRNVYRPWSSLSPGEAGLLDRAEALGQLDVRAPRILDERDRDVQRIDAAVRHGQRNAVGFELLRERFEVLYLEADVIERAALRRNGRRLRRREAQRDAGQL